MAHEKLKKLISSIIKEEMGIKETEKVDENFLDETDLDEAGKGEEDSKDETGAEDEEISIEDEAPEAEVDVDAEPELDLGSNEADMGGAEAEIQDLLSAAIEKAKELGDPKLVKQIGNTITFFTRSHVVGDTEQMDMGGIDLQERKDFKKKMQTLAGINK